MIPRLPTVLHLLNASDAGGVVRYVIDVGLALRGRGWRVAVACDRGAWHEQLVASGLEVVDVPITRDIRGFFRSATILGRWRDANGIDLMHAHYRRSTRLARRIQRRRGAPPILYTLHLSHLDVRGWKRWLSDFGDHAHVASDDARRWITTEARVDPDRVTLIPHGIDVSRWPVTTPADREAARHELRLGEDDLVALFVGRIDGQKQPCWIVDAARALAETHPRVRWLMVGDGPDAAALGEAISRLGIGHPGRVELVRWLGERDPLTPYRAADLLVSSSWREGFGYAPAEALATGLPVLRTRTSGTHETIVEGVSGRSVPVDKPAFIAAAGQLLADPAALAAMRPACAAHAREHLDADRQHGDTLALYQRLTRDIRRHGIGR